MEHPLSTALKGADKILELVYRDLAQPGVKQVGKAIGSLLGLGNTVLIPLRLLNEVAETRFTRHMEEYRKRLESIPENEVVPVDPEIGVPILEKLTYINNETIAEMFVSLLASASSAATLQTVHPSFITIISNISPDEARLVGYFANNTYLPWVTVWIITNERGGGYAHWERGVWIGDLELTFESNFGMYILNLVGLGIVEISNEEWLADDEYYAPIVERLDPVLKKLENEQPPKEYEVKKGFYRVTPYGTAFIRACGLEGSSEGNKS
jgi:tetrahydromethanopterin S-methyltransferase subunit G